MLFLPLPQFDLCLRPLHARLPTLHKEHNQSHFMTQKSRVGQKAVPQMCVVSAQLLKSKQKDLHLKCDLTSGDTEITGMRDEEIIGQLPGLQALESVVQAAVESFHCRSDPGGIHLISNQDTKRRLGHIELKALVKLSREY